MATSDGQDDFILSRDRYNNTCLHYVALFDDENFIISLIKMLDKVDKDFPFKLKHLDILFAPDTYCYLYLLVKYIS